MTDRTPVEIRQAHDDDQEAVVAFTRQTWPQRDDYVPRVFGEWVESDGPTQRTFVATIDDEPVGICQGVLLTDHEAWAQGIRVHPDHRGVSVGSRLTDAVFEWASRQGATVCRNVVFSWTAVGLGHARAMGFDPLAEFRWAKPEPDADADPELGVRFEPSVAWSAFHGSDAYHALVGLGLDLEESWAFAEVTRDRLADADATIAVVDDAGVCGMTYRTQIFEHETDDDDESWAEYGISAWTDERAFRSLAAAVARDAAELGADRARMVIPETSRHVTDVACARVAAADAPDFVLECDLLAETRKRG